jgi:adenylylsulfate kinase
MRLLESQRRSILKAISYRFVGASLGALLALLLTKRLSLALTFGLLDIVVKIGGYYVHERIWDRINYGRVPPSDFEI